MKINTNSFKDGIQSKLSLTYNIVNKYSGGVLGVFNHALKSFSEVYGTEGAASIAYFVFFSLIPLLLLLVSIAGFFLVDIDAIDQILDVLSQEIPLPRELIESNLRQLYDARNITGFIGLIGLAWSASSSFLSLARNINRAWSDAKFLNVIQGRLFALAIIFGLITAMILWNSTTTVVNYISRIEVPVMGEIPLQQTLFWRLSSGAIPWFVIFLAFMTFYRWVPNTKVRWVEAFWGAVATTVGIFIATRAFTWVLSTGLVNFQLIYGSLGTLLAFLTWVYISAFIAIFGAHISSAVAATKRKDKGSNGDEDSNN